jgi:hypothetical protein
MLRRVLLLATAVAVGGILIGGTAVSTSAAGLLVRLGQSCSSSDGLTWFTAGTLAPTAESPRHRTSTAFVASHQQVAAVDDLVRTLPSIGREFVNFYIRPRRAAERRLGAKGGPGVLAVVSWCLALVALAYGLYRVVFGTSVSTRLLALPISAQRSNVEASLDTKPRIEGIYWLPKQIAVSRDRQGNIIGHSSSWSFGVAVVAPEAKPPDQPQHIIVDMGAVTVVTANVVPNRLRPRVLSLFSIALLTFGTVLLIYPFARLFGSRPSIETALGVTAIYYAYALLLLGLFILAAVVILIDGLHLHPTHPAFLAPYLIGGALSLAAAVWSFVGVFGYVYALSVAQLVLAGVGAFALGNVASLVVTPLIFVPLLYVLLRFQDLWDVVTG